jgi:hypothetical protein
VRQRRDCVRAVRSLLRDVARSDASPRALHPMRRRTVIALVLHTAAVRSLCPLPCVRYPAAWGGPPARCLILCPSVAAASLALPSPDSHRQRINTAAGGRRCGPSPCCAAAALCGPCSDRQLHVAACCCRRRCRPCRPSCTALCTAV